MTTLLTFTHPQNFPLNSSFFRPFHRLQFPFLQVTFHDFSPLRLHAVITCTRHGHYLYVPRLLVPCMKAAHLQKMFPFSGSFVLGQVCIMGRRSPRIGTDDLQVVYIISNRVLILYFTNYFAQDTCGNKSRIAMENAAPNTKNLLTRKLDLILWKRLATCYIWSIALYGAGTWTLRKVDQKCLESFEMCG